MTALLLALSLSNSFTKVGAIVAFAAIVGIALLAMLFFAQARELKRLRQWSEEEPRRLAEFEHRLTSALSLRIQRATAQVARPAQAAAAVAPASRVVSQAPLAAGRPMVKLLPAAPAVIAGNAAVPPAPEPAQEPRGVEAAGASEVLPAPPADVEPVVSAAPSSAQPPSREEESRNGAEEVPALAAVAADAALAASASPSAPVAARPAVPAPRAPSPPPSSASGARARGSAPDAPARSAPRRPSDAAPPGAGSGSPRRSAPPLSGGRSQPSRRPVRRRGGPPPGPPFLREERASRRGALLVVGAAVVAIVLLFVLLTSGGGSSNKSASTATSPSTLSSSTGEGTHTGTHHSETSLPASSPSETHVVVLNATETGGLAHRLSGNLQQSGYTLAAALNGHPSGRSTTVVEYAPGHRVDARHVAQTLGVSQTQLLQSSIAAMDGGSATVVVVAGSDLASASTSAGSGSTTGSGSATGTGAATGAGSEAGTGAAEGTGGEAAPGAEGTSGTPGEAAGGTGH